MEDANEIQEALSRSYGTPEIDEDDLAAGGQKHFSLSSMMVLDFNTAAHCCYLATGW